MRVFESSIPPLPEKDKNSLFCFLLGRGAELMQGTRDCQLTQDMHRGISDCFRRYKIVS